MQQLLIKLSDTFNYRFITLRFEENNINCNFYSGLIFRLLEFKLKMFLKSTVHQIFYLSEERVF